MYAPDHHLAAVYARSRHAEFVAEAERARRLAAVRPAASPAAPAATKLLNIASLRALRARRAAPGLTPTAA